MKKKTISIVMFLFLGLFSANAQIVPDNNSFVPKTPEATKFEQYGKFKMSFSSGLFHPPKYAVGTFFCPSVNAIHQ